MLNQDESQLLKIAALLSIWIVVGVGVSFFIVPARDVFHFLAIGLAPFYIPAIVVVGILGYGRMTEPEWRKKGRAARKLRERQKR